MRTSRAADRTQQLEQTGILQHFERFLQVYDEHFAPHPEGPVARWDLLELIARVLDHLPRPRQQMNRYCEPDIERRRIG